MTATFINAFYELLCMLWRSLGIFVPPTPCGMRCHCSTSWGSDSGNGISHVPTGFKYPRGGGLKMDWDPEV